MENITSEELKYILLHELTHLKRKDNIIIWVSLIIKIIYWFNPIIIMAMNLMQRDCELACDTNVLNKVDYRENINYGMAILKVLNSINSNRQYIGTITMIRNKKDVKERISMISKNKKYGFKTLIIGAVLISVLCWVGLTSKSSEATNVLNEGIINSDIVIYNTHYHEAYAKGLTVKDAAKMLSNNLKEEGFDSEFLDNIKIGPYIESYNRSTDLLSERVENYEDKMLIDIHTAADNGDDYENKRAIKIVLNKASVSYEVRKVFVDKLLNELKLQGVTVNSEYMDYPD